MVPKDKVGDSSVPDLWKETLRNGGYEPPRLTRIGCLRLRFLSRAWRRILRVTGFKRSNPVRALEFGCGGGAHLVPLAANGWDCTGVDCSVEVVARAQAYVEQARGLACGRLGKVKFFCGDFKDFAATESYDITYQFGVLEHFLDATERMQYLEKMFALTKEDGYVVSVVPNGKHPLRQQQRQRGLGGYSIPEIDYTRELMEREMQACGGVHVIVLPHDVLGYTRMLQGGWFRKLTFRAAYLLFQLPLISWLPIKILDEHAYWFIGIAKKHTI